MNQVPKLLATLLLLAQPASAAERYAVTGMILTVDTSHRRFTASIEAVPDHMPAMVMPFEVLQISELKDLTPGAVVTFMFAADASTPHAEHIRVLRYQSVEQDPFTASRLKLLNEITSGRQAKPLAVGEVVPDFTLIDQTYHRVSLSDLRGRVVVVSFIYTSCRLPTFCLRIANNFGVLQKRFKAQLGRDLVLVTVTFDPAHDSPDVLARYASQWNANAASWHFVTGPAPDIQRVCSMFGVDAFPEEGLMNHSLHTAIIDRQGRLVVNIEGNQFSAVQLGDLTRTTLHR